jgi:hypothetical protein
MSTKKFMNKYRIASARKHGWDYSDEGAYLPAGRQVLLPYAQQGVFVGLAILITNR